MIRNKNSLDINGFAFSPRSETEAFGNSEMSYYSC